MNKQDLLQIRGVVTEVVTEVVDQRLMSLMEHQIMPQFELIHNRIDKLEVRMERVETKVDRIESRLDRVETRLDRLETTVERMDTRLGRVEDNMLSHGMSFKPAT